MAAAPFRPLPAGVYFNPSAEECVREYLRPWIAGVRPATDRVIVGVDIYSDHPAALVRGREPGFSRGFEHRWLMLTHCVRVFGGRGGKARVKRDVATGGNWKVEQRSKGVVGDDDDLDGGGDRRRTTGFYLPGSSGGGGTKKGKKNAGVKTPWLMEELTTEEDEAAAAGGWRGERIFKVFCKIYISPRATNDEKRDILGDDMVAVDIHGKTKTIEFSVPKGLFDALAQNFEEAEGQPPAPPPPPPPPPPRVLGHYKGKLAVPPPLPPPRVLGHRQGQPAAAPPLRVQYGQAAATPTPAILRHQHGHGAVMPLGVPANHHHPGFLGYRHGQAAPATLQIQGVAAPPQMRLVLDPYHEFFQEASLGVAGYYNNLYCYPAPPLLRPDPQQGEGMVTHMEKKPRLAYGSPPDGDMPSCVVQDSTAQEKCGGTGADIKVLQEAEPVPTAPPPPPPQEIPGTATAPPPPPQEIPGTATAPPEPADDAPEAATESMRECDIFTDLPDLTFVADDGPDFLNPRGTFEPPPDDEPPPPPGFDEFSWEELMKDAPDFCRQPGSLD